MAAAAVEDASAAAAAASERCWPLRAVATSPRDPRRAHAGSSRRRERDAPRCAGRPTGRRRGAALVRRDGGGGGGTALATRRRRRAAIDVATNCSVEARRRQGGGAQAGRDLTTYGANRRRGGEHAGCLAGERTSAEDRMTRRGDRESARRRRHCADLALLRECEICMDVRQAAATLVLPALLPDRRPRGRRAEVPDLPRARRRRRAGRPGQRRADVGAA